MGLIQMVDLIVGIVMCVLIFAFLCLLIRRKILWIVFFIEIAVLPVLYFLGMYFSFYFVLALFVLSALLSLFINIGEIREYLVNPVRKKGGISGSKSSEAKNIDRVKLNKTITEAVRWLSDNKTGALITFERGVNLDTYIASGTLINAPVTAELIETIFYEGTRLHDGAIVIRGNTIVAASVFYTATTRTLVGKYGARHRAALGVSETTDSITVVVSEETGRISVAFSGMLESIKYDEFEKVFSSFMLAPNGNIGNTILKSLNLEGDGE